MNNTERVIKSVYLITMILLISCSVGKNRLTDVQRKNKQEDFSDGDKKFIVTVPVVRKEYPKTKDKLVDFEELYLRRSIKDYFIKFCESKISREELENHLSKTADMIQSVTVEIEFRDGEWDICEGDSFDKHSRTGEYVIIHRLVPSSPNDSKNKN